MTLIEWLIEHCGNLTADQVRAIERLSCRRGGGCGGAAEFGAGDVDGKLCPMVVVAGELSVITKDGEMLSVGQSAQMSCKFD